MGSVPAHVHGCSHSFSAFEKCTGESFAGTVPCRRDGNPQAVSLLLDATFVTPRNADALFMEFGWDVSPAHHANVMPPVSYRHFAVTLDLFLMFKCIPDSCTVQRDGLPPGFLSPAPRRVGALSGSVVRLGRPRRPGRMRQCVRSESAWGKA